jgi:hypothetical protein
VGKHSNSVRRFAEFGKLPAFGNSCDDRQGRLCFSTLTTLTGCLGAGRVKVDPVTIRVGEVPADIQTCFDRLVPAPKKGPMSKKQVLALVAEDLRAREEPVRQETAHMGEAVSIAPSTSTHEARPEQSARTFRLAGSEMRPTTQAQARLRASARRRAVLLRPAHQRTKANETQIV